MTRSPQDAAVDDEEDDYMSMAIAEPAKTQTESSVQRAARRKREGEERGRAKSKQELKAEEAAAREAALSTAIDSSNKGFKMMAKLGYKPGQTLGKSEGARSEPISVEMREGRGGIGLDSERKRKIREEFEHEAKRVKETESDYRERRRMEEQERRLEGELIGAQKVLQRFDTDAEDLAREEGRPPSKPKLKTPHRPNVLWRGLVQHEIEKEREAKMRRNLREFFSKDSTDGDSDEDEHDRQALGKDLDPLEDLDEEDPELDEFNALPRAERLEKVVHALREQYNYCFWCKYQYPDRAMEGCPGLTEEDHD
ncbi:G-patch-domain-containing protein [Rhizodiscina lignyota]|uniref:G-patch-domain-containing protein n=1 Tax=Rhizodiscina lignyota TaxID=1504668 RepID=A0A9P4M651_9PEZI|nr:G-patch-domain-containing protein [Rhizodiscina lignyota]